MEGRISYSEDETCFKNSKMSLFIPSSPLSLPSLLSLPSFLQLQHKHSYLLSHAHRNFILQGELAKICLFIEPTPEDKLLMLNKMSSFIEREKELKIKRKKEEKEREKQQKEKQKQKQKEEEEQQQPITEEKEKEQTEKKEQDYKLQLKEKKRRKRRKRRIIDGLVELPKDSFFANLNTQPHFLPNPLDTSEEGWEGGNNMNDYSFQINTISDQKPKNFCGELRKYQKEKTDKKGKEKKEEGTDRNNSIFASSWKNGDHRNGSGFLLPTGDILYSFEFPIRIKEEYVDKEISLIIRITPPPFPNYIFHFPLDQKCLSQTLGVNLASASPPKRTSQLRLFLYSPLMVQFSRNLIENEVLVSVTITNKYQHSHLPDEESKVWIRKIRVDKEKTYFIPTALRSPSLAPSRPSFVNWSTVPLPAKPIPSEPTEIKAASPIAKNNHNSHTKLDFDKYFTSQVYHVSKESLRGSESMVSVISLNSTPSLETDFFMIEGTFQSYVQVVWEMFGGVGVHQSSFPFSWPRTPNQLIQLSYSFCFCGRNSV